MAIGFRIFPSPARADPKLLERLRALPVFNVSDNGELMSGWARKRGIAGFVIDGVVAIPPQDAERVIAAAEAQHRKEQAAIAAIASGTYDRSWVDGALKARGCDLAG